MGTALVTLAGIIVAGDGSRAPSNSLREHIAINVLFHGHKPLQGCTIQVLPSWGYKSAASGDNSALPVATVCEDPQS